MNLNDLMHELATTGGFTYNITTGEYDVTDGYIVSLKGFEEQLYLDDFENKDISNFIGKHVSFFIKEEYFVGGWVDGNTVYLDVSIKVNDLEEALLLGLTNNQKAIYDAKNKRTIDLPSAQTSGTMTQNKTYNIMKAKQLAFVMETTGKE